MDTVKRHKAYKYRIYPTDQQKKFFAVNFGHCRFVYNAGIDMRTMSYRDNGESINYAQTNKALTFLKKLCPWLCDADSAALQMALRNCDKAFDHFFDKTAGYPQHKTKKSHKSYTTPMNGGSIKVGKNHIVLPKAGKIKASLHRRAPESYVLKSATVSMEKDGSYYVSLSYEYNIGLSPFDYEFDNIIGLDYKSDGLFVSSDGWIADTPHYYRMSEKRLYKEQHRLSRMIESHIVSYKSGPKGGRIPIYSKPLDECKNIQKQKHKIAKLNRRVANQRMDYLQKLSTEIANQYDGICVESLNMRTMANKGFGNGKATLDNGYGSFLNMLEYKLKEQGKPFIKVDKWYPSSQLCSNCGHQMLMPLKVRTYECPICGMVLDRDLNAAINIRAEGIRMLLSGEFNIEEYLKPKERKRMTTQKNKTKKAA